MSRLLVIQHLEREGPGLFADEAARRGWELTVCRPDRGEPLPRLAAGQAVLVLGGPMGVGDIGSPAYPWLAGEVELLRECLDCQRPVIGICLGAQLLAFAAGGRVVPLAVGEPPSRVYEVGWGAVSWTADAASEPVLEGLGGSELVLHWHGDRILLPEVATLLGSSLLCPEQMFRIGSHAYGLQFHVEMTAPMLERWLEDDAVFVRTALGADGSERIRRDQRRWGAAAERQGQLLIQNLLDRVGQLLGAFPLA